MNREQLEKLLRQAQVKHYQVITSEVEINKTITEADETVVDSVSSAINSPYITLYFVEARERVILELRQPQKLGRSHVYNPMYDGVDLEPFNAFAHGVSRDHATLTLEQGNVILRDLESLNGTFLNGVRLSPEYDYILRNGDNVKFADLEVRVTFVH